MGSADEAAAALRNAASILQDTAGAMEHVRAGVDSAWNYVQQAGDKYAEKYGDRMSGAGERMGQVIAQMLQDVQNFEVDAANEQRGTA
jgi:hypothetical protein